MSRAYLGTTRSTNAAAFTGPLRLAALQRDKTEKKL